jgi:hypothetical protein
MKFNTVRILGIIIAVSGYLTHLLIGASEYSTLLGVSTAIGIGLLVYGRLNIFKGIKR